MPARAHRFGSALLILVLLAAPLAVHGALVMHRASGLAGILVATQAALVAWIALSAISRRTLRAGACGGVFLFVLFLSRWTDGGPVIASGVPHAMAYAAVLALFAASLRPGREPVVTILARRSRGPVPRRKLCDTPVVSRGRGAGFAWHSLLLHSCCCCSRRARSGRASSTYATYRWSLRCSARNTCIVSGDMLRDRPSV